MRRLSGVILGAVLMLPAISQSAFAQAAAAPQKFTMEGELALWTVAIKADKTADYEQVLNKVKEVLNKAEAPEAKQQLAGWMVYKLPKPHTDGSTLYMHVIKPVPGADYNLLQVLYQTIKDPAEQKTLYELYRGAFVSNLGLSSAALAIDMSK